IALELADSTLGTEWCLACQKMTANTTTAITATAAAAIHRKRRFRVTGADSAKAENLLDSVSRFSRCKSVRMSEACWYRRLRSFSRHLLMISSSFGGISGLIRIGEAGGRSRIALKITPEVSPRNGTVPVAIS